MQQPTPFTPRLDILPASQRRLWPELGAVPDEFVVYRGTALALHLGHRDREYFTSQLQSPQAWFAALQHYVQLYQALAGGWQS
jgi:hypothetical protein